MQSTSASLGLSPRWTVLSLLQWGAEYLTERGFDEARLHTELLLAHALRCSRLELYTNFDRPMTEEELAQFKVLFKRRLTHEPLQYILGETEFMGIRLAVDRRVLIPRPETEQLVEHVLSVIKGNGTPDLRLLEIGTGSGNIAIALAKFAPSLCITAVDVSEEALRLAKDNAEATAVRSIEFVHADIFDDILPGRMFDVIVSNPPYISLEEFHSLQPEVRDFEPRLATTDEADGLRFIRRIALFAAERLVPEGWLFMEISYNQAPLVQHIVEHAGLRYGGVVNDFAGHPRILSARK
ncbi:MAG: peptide chain release factor N(5)-glutamine methyltransferase [Ignavibacteria bacterium]